MSFLDLYQKDQAVSAQPRPNEARDLPAAFTEAFHKSVSDAALFGQSTAYLNARTAAAADYATEIADKTGDQTLHAAMATGGLAGLNKRLAVLREANPDLGINLLTDEELDRRGLERSTKAHVAAQEMAGREKSLGGKLGGLSGGLVGAGTDIINIVALPVAPAEGIGLLATALRWGLITGTSQTAIEVAGGAYHERVQPGYFATGAPVVNILEATIGGAAIGGGIKALGNLWTRAKTGAWPQSVRDAGNIIESEANVANTNIYPGTAGEVAHRTALQDSIENMINGRPINVEREVTPSLLGAYEQRLGPVMEARAKAIGADESAFAIEREGARLPPTMERLSEVQLGDFRTSSRQVEAAALEQRARITAEQEGLTGQRVALAGHMEARDALRGEVEALRNEVGAVQSKAAQARPPIDEATQGRLGAIEAELGAKPTNARRAELERERTSITETLAKTGPEDRRLIASLEAEASGLEKAAAKKEKELAKAEQKVAKVTDAVAKQEAALPAREARIGERLAAAQEAATGALRKAVGRLAKDGYGIRMERAEAQALAERIMAAPDDQAGAVLRQITEELVDRAQAARAAKPAPELPFGTSEPTAQERARADFHTEEMRKGVTALAREVGHVLPREDAVIIADALRHARNETEALAILDELMLRPRTLAETLPGTSHLIPEPAARSAAPAPVERIVGAAVIDENGKTYVGINHAMAASLAEAQGAKLSPIPDNIDGFMTSTGRYVSRKEAAKIADRAEQIKTADDLHDSDADITAMREQYRGEIVSGERGLESSYLKPGYRDAPPPLAREEAPPIAPAASSPAPDPVGVGMDPVKLRAAADAFARGDRVEAERLMSEGVRSWPGTGAAREAMAPELTPKRAAELRADPEVNDVVLRDLDRLRAEKGDIEIPMGETIDAAGERVALKRSVESIMAEADARELAAKEIAACVGPQEVAG